MAVAIAPLLAELGTVASGVLVEAGISEYIATTVVGVLISKAGDYVDAQTKKILTKAELMLLGAENIKKLESFKKIYDAGPKMGFTGQHTGNIPSQFLPQTSAGTQPKQNIPDPFATDTVINTNQEIIRASTKVNAKQLADLLINHTTKIAESGNTVGLEHIGPLVTSDGKTLAPNLTHEEIINDIGKDPNDMTLLQKLSNFYANKSITYDAEYKKIQAVYNGKGLSPKNTIFKETPSEYQFYAYDEVGVLMTLKQLKKDRTIPAVYGVFGGVKSPNNFLPTDKVDSYFMFHDSDFTNGFFGTDAIVGNMKLVSRLTQNRNYWPSSQVQKLNAIVIYFATLGRSLSMLKGSGAEDDILPVLMPEVVGLEEYPRIKEEFYSELDKSLQEAYTLTSVMRPMIKKINVQLL